MNPVYSNLISNDLIIDNGYLYLSSGMGNRVYQISIDKKEVVDSFEIVSESSDSYLLYMSGIKHGGKIYFAPHTANCICTFDMEGHCIDTIDFDGIETEKAIGLAIGKFTYSFAMDGKLYLLGFNIPAILQYDINTKSSIVIPICNNNIEKYNGWGYFSQGIVQETDDIYMIPMGCCGNIVRFDVSQKHAEIVPMPFSATLEGVGGMSADENGDIWITSRNTKENKVVLWKRKQNQTEIFALKNTLQEKGTYYAPIITDEYIYIFPESIDHIYKISRKTKKLEIVLELEEAINSKKPSLYFGAGIVGLRKDGCKIRFFTCWDYALNEYDFVNNKNEKYYIDIGDDSQKCYFKMMSDKVKSVGYINEADLDLNDFIKFVEQGRKL